MTEWLERNGFIPIPAPSLTDDDIKVLKSILGEPWEEDTMRLIDADELKTAFPTCDNSKSILIASVRATINHMPTIEERKTGKWIIQDNPETGWYRVVCSECGENVTSNIPMIGFFPHCKPLWDYCPYCGADMRGEGHE